MCVASTTYLARNCEKSIQCMECGSERHHSELHPWPVKESTNAPTHPEEHGRDEKIDTPPDTVSSRCTEVCGRDLFGKSCSQICLVKLFPSGQQEKAVRVYAIVDDQSNRSLVRSDAFTLFDIKGDSSPYSLRTCAGIVEMAGRRLQG